MRTDHATEELLRELAQQLLGVLVPWRASAAAALFLVPQ